MATTQQKVDKKLDEAYMHIKPYIQNQTTLTELCQSCECWMGKEHDYSECREKPCFRCWLALIYLEWETSYE